LKIKAKPTSAEQSGDRTKALRHGWAFAWATAEGTIDVENRNRTLKQFRIELKFLTQLFRKFLQSNYVNSMMQK